MIDRRAVQSRTVDTHVHVGRDRYGPIEPYLATMDRLGVAAAVLVARQWQYDNRELFEAARVAPGRFRVVAAVDLDAPSAFVELDRVVEAGAVGIRVDPEVLTRVPKAIIDRLAASPLVVSLTARPEVLAIPALARALDHVPNPLRMEHFGGLRAHHLERDDPWRRAILALAERPNMNMMWSGLWLNAGVPWPYEPAHDLLADVVDAFGPARICWSGDWNRPEPTGAHISDDDYSAEAALVVRLAGPAAPAILSETGVRLFALRGLEVPVGPQGAERP